MADSVCHITCSLEQNYECCQLQLKKLPPGGAVNNKPAVENNKPAVENNKPAKGATSHNKLAKCSILDIICKEFGDFQKKTGPYGYHPGTFLTPDALDGNSSVWNCLAYTCVIGFVACQVTSKRLGIGSAERSWSDVKQLKDGKWSNLGGSSLEK